ncbi:hypothetical protein P6439_14270 [Staphylococcus arlettae]|nr:hypothetical protein [Staphylococcus arlettae]
MEMTAQFEHELKALLQRIKLSAMGRCSSKEVLDLISLTGIRR